MKPITSLEEVDLVLWPFWPTNLKRPAYTTEHIERFMDYIGNPQDIPRSVHVAGTSGKTSTSYYVAALLKQAGKKVGLLTSPHIEGLNERVQIDLVPLAEKEFCAEMTVFMNILEQSKITLTYAEILYGFAFWEFARHKVDYIVVEVGMGGLLDATNVIHRPDKICVITDIGMDHVHVLGETLHEIAGHKAGIIHLHNAVFCHPQEPEIMQVIEKACKQRQADLHITEQDQRTPSFLPLFQRRNFSLALEVISFVLEREDKTPLVPDQIEEAAHTHIPARMELFERAGKTIVLDNAHNTQKLHGLRLSLAAQFPDKKIAMLVAFVETPGRSIDEMAEELAACASRLIVTELPPGNRLRKGKSPQDVVTACNKFGLTCEVVEDYSEAYQRLLSCPEPVAVVTGSTYLLEDLRPLVVQG